PRGHPTLESGTHNRARQDRLSSRQERDMAIKFERDSGGSRPSADELRPKASGSRWTGGYDRPAPRKQERPPKQSNPFRPRPGLPKTGGGDEGIVDQGQRKNKGTAGGMGDFRQVERKNQREQLPPQADKYIKI